MKTIHVIILWLITTLRLIAPEFHALPVFPAEKIYRWNMDYLLWAVAKVESNFDIYAVNPLSGAKGLLQITQPTIDEANRLSDSKYSLEDAWSPEKSIEIWQLLNKHHNPEYELDKACRLWFGSGKEVGSGRIWEDYKKLILKHIKP